MARQPRGNLHTLYQGWMDTVASLLAARLIGAFAPAAFHEQASSCLNTLAECARLETQMAGLRPSAAKEKQVARKVELNLEPKRLEAMRAAALPKL